VGVVMLALLVAPLGCAPRTASPASPKAAKAALAVRSTFPAALPDAPNQVEVWPLSYRAPLFGRSGVSRPNWIEVRKAGACSPVSIGEEYSGGAMGMLRASIWFSAVTAARFLGRPITDYCLRVDMTGHVDGPSAGGLMTAGIMAAMLGIPVREDATLTGTVNIGGAVGPVGGYRSKLQAAANVARPRVGLPTAVPPKQMKQLRAEARLHNLTLSRLDTVLDAFRLITGRATPSTRVLPRSEMVIAPAVARAARKEGLSLLAQARQLLKQDPLKTNKVPALLWNELVGMKNQAGEQIQLAEELLAAGRPTEALFAATDAYSAATAMAGCAEMVSGADRATLVQRLKISLKETPVNDVVRRVGRKIMMTGGSITRSAGELALAVEMMNAANRAHRLLRNKPKEDRITAAYRELIRARAALATADAQRHFNRSIGDGFMVHQENLMRASQALTVEAEARLAYARALVKAGAGNWWDMELVKRESGNLGFSESYAREYQAAWPHIIQLGSARASLSNTGAALVAAEGPRVDASGRAVEQYDHLARTYAALVKRHTGFVPTMALAHYRMARYLIEKRRFSDARRALDSAIAECQTWLWLHGGDARKDPMDQVSKAQPYPAHVEEW